jgi:uncharacterized protein YbjT (DUF2867 family)
LKILVTGATGYVGSKLVPELLQSGHAVRCLVRKLTAQKKSALPGAEFAEADVMNLGTLDPALRDIEVAYYLIHSMGTDEGGFEERDRLAARNFAIAARRAGVKRIIYLGGLGSDALSASTHLKSRLETGTTLREFGPPLTEFRAGIIVGNGSVSFELIRHLTERLPVMICPRWVVTRVQPIGIDDVLKYLVAALAEIQSIAQVVEIGGSSLETYRSMMLIYAKARNLKRWLLQVPFLTPRLSSYWLRIVTPLPSSITRPLIEGLRTEVVCKSSLAQQIFPQIRPESYEATVEKAANRTIPDESFQADIGFEKMHASVRRKGLICDVWQIRTRSSTERVFEVVDSLGGKNGWLYSNFLWQLRGWIDCAFGGNGMKFGRRSKGALSLGDYVDFWQVGWVVPSKHLLLRAEMKLPGRAWLQFDLFPERKDETLLRCSAWFEPRGLAGEIYWWGLYPVHLMIFRGLMAAIGERSEQGS